jgi:hypothetical protein
MRWSFEPGTATDVAQAAVPSISGDLPVSGCREAAGDVEVAGDDGRHAEAGVQGFPVEAGPEVPSVRECRHHESADDPVVSSGIEEAGDVREGHIAEVIRRPIRRPA